MNKFDARTLLQLKKKSKLFFSLAVIAGSMQHVYASSVTSLGYVEVSEAKNLVAKQGQVSGKVLDGTGNPVPGVTISVKGSPGGTQTGQDGSFSINAKVGDVLVVSSVGYKTSETKVTSTTGLTIRLESTADQLDEVVVVGYGTMRKSDVTGSIAMVKGADMIKDQNLVHWTT